MSGSFSELLTEDMRLVILRCLNEDRCYSLNDSMLHSMLNVLGHHCSRDKVRTELAWLADQGLVTVSVVVNVQVATLTERGADVAVGRATVPGVKRPRPGA